MKPAMFLTAGTKDKRAKTSQLVIFKPSGHLLLNNIMKCSEM